MRRVVVVPARIPDARWAALASHLVPTAVSEAVIAWLDAGQPNPDRAARLVLGVVGGIVEAARAAGGENSWGPRLRVILP